MKPPRPKRCSRYRCEYGFVVPLVPSGNTSTSWPSSASRRWALAGLATTPPLRARNVPTNGASRSIQWCSAVDGPAGRALDPVHQQGGIHRQRAGVVGDEQRTTRRGYVLDAVRARRGTIARRPARSSAGPSAGSAPTVPTRRRRPCRASRPARQPAAAQLLDGRWRRTGHGPAAPTPAGAGRASGRPRPAHATGPLASTLQPRWSTLRTPSISNVTAAARTPPATASRRRCG